jgi:RNA polymerase sigma-70 factor, ECF subfamily
MEPVGHPDVAVVTIAIARTGAAVEMSLAERARHGDREAFERLVDARLASTFRIAMAILGNEADARDATQEAFLRAWRDLPGLRDAERFDAWFGRIVVNACRSAVRGRRRRSVREIPVGALPRGGEGFDPATHSDEARVGDADLLDRALDRLTVAERTLLTLHHLEELSLEAIARQMGIPAKTVKSRLFSARRALERALEVERR